MPIQVGEPCKSFQAVIQGTVQACTVLLQQAHKRRYSAYLRLGVAAEHTRDETAGGTHNAFAQCDTCRWPCAFQDTPTTSTTFGSLPPQRSTQQTTMRSTCSVSKHKAAAGTFGKPELLRGRILWWMLLAAEERHLQASLSAQS